MHRGVRGVAPVNCAVLEVTYQMLFTSAAAVTLRLAGSDGPADTKGIVA